jgi:predicted nucleic acid-binding protein
MVLVPKVVLDELQMGVGKGHCSYDAVRLWEKQGLVQQVDFGSQGRILFEMLVRGNVSSTLDDGEAATLASASELRAKALIDERKARRLANELDPKICVVSTAELLLSHEVSGWLGIDGQRTALENAIREARMSIPDELVDKVVSILGMERACDMSSLPRRIRLAALRQDA